VLVAGGLALVLLGGLSAWLAVHQRTEPIAEAPAPPAPEVPPAAVAPAAGVEDSPPAEQHDRKHISARRAATDHHAAAERGSPEPAKAPPSDPPASAEPKKAPPAEPVPLEPKKEPAPPAGLAPKRPAGETYGTSVLFLSNTEQAAKVALAEAKLLFVLHVSGNFEESCFT
jgi:hypothetical protein